MTEGDPVESDSHELSRRNFLATMGGATAATAAVCALPEFLGARGWASPVGATGLAVDRDTYNGLAAMVWPGDDTYSVAQRESTGRPGAVAANAGSQMLSLLDSLVAAPDNLVSNDLTIPLSTLVASAINSVALTINPLAALGKFAAPFARLTIGDKVKTWRRLEEDTASVVALDPTHTVGVLRYVFCALPAFVQFLALTEGDVLDPATGALLRRPVGWAHTGYLGTSLVASDGWDEFKGYYGNRRQVLG